MIKFYMFSSQGSIDYNPGKPVVLEGVACHVQQNCFLRRPVLSAGYLRKDPMWFYLNMNIIGGRNMLKRRMKRFGIVGPGVGSLWPQV